MNRTFAFGILGLIVVGCVSEPKPIEHPEVRKETANSQPQTQSDSNVVVATKMTVVDVPLEAEKVDVQWSGNKGNGLLNPISKEGDSSFVQATQDLKTGDYKFVVKALDKSGRVVASSENCKGETAEEFRTAEIGEKSNAVVLRLCRPEKKVFIKAEIKLGEKSGVVRP